MSKVQVYRDGEPVSPVFDTPDEAFLWLHKHQGQSVAWALVHGGYSFETVES